MVISEEERTDFENILSESREVLKREPTFIELPKRPTVFVGDTHGDMLSTKEVFSKFLGHYTIVFLGDYVDRAPKNGSSIYNLRDILKAKIENPNDVFLLRGNHEFEKVWRYGFREELELSKLESLIPEIRSTLSDLPYVAITPNGILALHAGIPNVQNLDELKKVPKGLHSFMENKTVSQLVWNDNLLKGKVGNKEDWMPNEGRGFYNDFSILYGQDFLDRNLNLFKANILVRGHDYRAKGHSLNDKILTIFTTQQYADRGPMKGRYVAKADVNKSINSTKDLEIISLG